MGDTPPAGVRVALVLVGVMLAWLTFTWLETPVRFGRASRHAAPALVASMAVILVAGVLTDRTGGWPERPVNRSTRAAFLQYYERMRRSGITEAYRAECDFMDWQTGTTRSAIADGCTAAGPNETWLLWGDSYAQALSPGLRAIAPAGTVVAQVATSLCRPSLGDRDSEIARGRCLRANTFALERIGALRPSVVVMAQADRHLESDWPALSERLASLGVQRTILVGPVPQWRPSLPEVIASQYWDSDSTRAAYGLDASPIDSDRVLRQRMNGVRGLTYVSVIEKLCNAEGCIGVLPGSSDRDLLVFDVGHLTPKGSVYVAEEVLQPLLGRQP